MKKGKTAKPAEFCGLYHFDGLLSEIPVLVLQKPRTFHVILAADFWFNGGSSQNRSRLPVSRIHMPLYLDIHNHIEGLTADAATGAHAHDLEVQAKHGVKYLKYWFDEGTSKMFCLIEAPNKEAAIAVHREAHGLVADEIVEVREGS